MAWIPARLTLASDGIAVEYFGRSVAVDGDTALVGADYADNSVGAGYVFVRSGGVWTEQQQLSASDGQNYDYFGYSVALSGDTALLGAREDDEIGVDSGSAYVFVRSGGVWTEQQKLLPSDGATTDNFGWSVALSGDTALIGAFLDDDNGSESGSAYTFVRSNSVWTQQQKLLPNDGTTNDRYGFSVALSGDTALVGAYVNGMYSGSAYAWVRNGVAWTQQAKLIASDGTAGDQFGYSVALSGDTVLVGAYTDDGNGNNSGSAYVFLRSGSVWAEQSKLVATDGAADDYFGYSVALSGDTALVGSIWDDDNGADSGSAYVFVLALSLGSPCTTGIECHSGFCVDGVCCNSICGGGATDDCGACSVAAGAMMDGTCSPLAAGTVCRASVDLCDIAESCDGLALLCAADAKVAAGTECRAVVGPCDVAEACDGAADTCPADGKVAAGTECRAAMGSCDVAEACDGAVDTCPADAKVAAGTECRAATGPCDVAEACDGVADACPADKKLAPLTECRASSGPCDVAETCDGMAGTCPGDGVATSQTICRAAADSCDIDDKCDGVSKNCPQDQIAPQGAVCRPAAGDCDTPETCTGASVACPGDAKIPAGTECRASAGECDVAEACDGLTDDCPANAGAPNGTVCTDGACIDGTCIHGAGGSGGGAGNGGSGGAAGGSPDAGADGWVRQPPGCGCRTVSSDGSDSARSLSVLSLALVVMRRRRHDGPGRQQRILGHRRRPSARSAARLAAASRRR